MHGPDSSRSSSAARRVLLAAACLGGAAACDGGDGGDGGEQPLPRCVEVDTACTPLFQPVYDEIYTRTLLAKCATEAARATQAATHSVRLTTAWRSSTPTRATVCSPRIAATTPSSPPAMPAAAR
ncbi:MAG: hypothetical protein U0168_15420 [Nannocystaceae bacterium]